MKGIIFIFLVSVLTGCSSFSSDNKTRKELDPDDFTTAYPIFTIPPQFPKRALIEAIAGKVELIFDIEKDGSVTNLRVVNAVPENLFEEEAIRAVSKWKFRPKLIDGKPAKQFDKIYIIDFNL